MEQLWKSWPDVPIVLRGDSGFCREPLMRCCESAGVDDLFGLDRSRNAETQPVYVRRWPRWYTAVSVEWDQTIDDFSITMSVWPGGAPGLAVGSKRFTGLGQSVGLRL